MDDFNVLDTIRSEIQAEHTLVSHRLTWYVTSQSFLMTAYAVSWNHEHELRVFFKYVIPSVGVLLSILVWIGVHYALVVQRDVIDLQKEVLARMRNSLQDSKDESEKERIQEYTKITGEGRPTKMKSHKRATLPPRLIPVLFFLTWILALGFSWNK